MVNINSNEPLFYPYSVAINKYIGSFNYINNPYAKLCVLDVVKNMNIKIFNLMTMTSETCHLFWHETCACKCRLHARVCNNRQHCRKRLIDKLVEECSDDIDGNEIFIMPNWKFIIPLCIIMKMYADLVHGT